MSAAAIQHDSSLDLYLDLKDARPLTDQDIAWGIEITLSRFGHRWIERNIESAESDSDALRFAKEHCRHGGYYGSDGHVAGCSKGIEIKREGRGGVVSFKALVEHVRAPSHRAQLPLFPILSST
jgi:hypothetical protein